MNKKIIIISIGAVILIATITVSILLFVEMNKNNKAATPQSKEQLVKAAETKATAGFKASDEGKTEEAIKDFEAAHEFYAQAGDTLGISKTTMYIEVAKKDREVPAMTIKSEGPLTETK